MIELSEAHRAQFRVIEAAAEYSVEPARIVALLLGSINTMLVGVELTRVDRKVISDALALTRAVVDGDISIDDLRAVAIARACGRADA